MLSQHSGVQVSKFHNCIWQLKASPSACYFLWRLSLGRPTMSGNLQKRKIQLAKDVYSCPFWGREEESNSHLLLTCYAMDRLGKWFYSWLDIRIVLPQAIHNHFWQHSSLVQKEVDSQVWNMVWLVVLWSLWTTRDNIIFNRGCYCLKV